MSPLSQPVPVCLFMVVVLLVPAMSLEKRYSNSWAVEVKGGQEVAEQLARKHGFINHGQVGNLQGVYHFELPDGMEEHSPGKTAALKEEATVSFVEQQHYKQMAKKLHH